MLRCWKVYTISLQKSGLNAHKKKKRKLLIKIEHERKKDYC